MEELPGRVFPRIISLLVFSAACAPAPCSSETLTATEIIRRAVERSNHTENREPGLAYTKATVTEEYDTAGHIKEHKERKYQVLLRGGVPSARLVEVNGQPPTESELKRQADNESKFRQLLGPSNSSKGVSRDSFLTPELAAHFDFTLTRMERISGRANYVMHFAPSQSAPKTGFLADKFLSHVTGTVWIDATEYEVARAEVKLNSQVDLLGGILGSLKKLSYSLSRTRLPDGVWLSTISTGDFEGRKLLESLRIKTKTVASNFRPLA